MDETLLLERDGPAGWLVFNRPEVGNAMDASMTAALPGAWARLEADAAVRELRRLGTRIPRRTRPHGTGTGMVALSTREREVAGLVAAGKSNKDIAAVLYLSEKTIESHLARIYNKLDVHSRAALTALIVREGTG